MTEVIFERKVADEILVEKASLLLNDGGIIVIPTDTIPGIGCKADNIDSVRKLFELKERPLNLAIPVVISDAAIAEDYTLDLPKIYYKLADRFWPGALTLVVKSNGKIDKLVGGGSDTLGLRVPDYPLLRDIIRSCESPLALTSANPHHLAPSGLHPRLLTWWNHKTDLIVLGKSTVTYPPSTVIDLTTDPPEILREGTITSEDLEFFLS
ncbi:MAG: L-threonylcarbamoyladenylate synthase [bacterium]